MNMKVVSLFKIKSLLLNKNEKLLNKDQLQVYNSIITALQSESPLTNTFFVDGPGGSGKTFLYNTILAKVRSSHKIALAVASSGIAAELLSGGRTAHSRFKIPIPIFETSTCNIPRNSSSENISYAPMIHKHVLECLHKTLCDLTGSPLPFGGKVILLGGDFRQVLPVIRHATQAEIIDSNIHNSKLSMCSRS